jgi:hypothetical protein
MTINDDGDSFSAPEAATGSSSTENESNNVRINVSLSPPALLSSSSSPSSHSPTNNSMLGGFQSELLQVLREQAENTFSTVADEEIEEERVNKKRKEGDSDTNNSIPDNNNNNNENDIHRIISSNISNVLSITAETSCTDDDNKDSGNNNVQVIHYKSRKVSAYNIALLFGGGYAGQPPGMRDEPHLQRNNSSLKQRTTKQGEARSKRRIQTINERSIKKMKKKESKGM